jgi:hypothetical protein
VSNLDSIGKKAAEQVRAFSEKKETSDAAASAAKDALAKVWDALEAGKTVNGCKSKDEWAKKWQVSTRMCRYILRGRKKRTGEHRNRAVPLKAGMLLSIDGRKFELVSWTLRQRTGRWFPTAT